MSVSEVHWLRSSSLEYEKGPGLKSKDFVSVLQNVPVFLVCKQGLARVNGD